MNTLERSTSQDSARYFPSISTLKQTISVLVTLLLWTLATGASAQPEAKPTAAAKTAPGTQPAGTPRPTCTPAQDNASPTDGDPKFIVALFRHGVRSPLEEFAEKSANKYSGSPWPLLTDWTGDKCANWGDLTPHGAIAVTNLGAWYGSNYSKALGNNFKAYLWADVAERTQKTAAALAAGLEGSGVKVTVGTLYSETADPLFHPYQATCGTPRQADLDQINQKIQAECSNWLRTFQDPLSKLNTVLACQNNPANQTLAPGPSPTSPPCKPLGSLEKTTCSPAPSPTPTPTPTATPTATPTPTQRPSSPIKWDGVFSYASSATEAFLLEYANNMPTPGWGGVKIGPLGSGPTVQELLRLHEFYFEITERNQYLARIQGANLLREICDQLNRKAGLPLMGKCPRGDGTSDFVGLVGHDTNLAHLNKLLNVEWNFEDQGLPDDTRNLPRNDALPAGALVFELYGESPNHLVRIQYVTQSLGQIRNAPQPAEPYLVQTTCGGCSPCVRSLGELNQIAKELKTNYSDFLSHCQDNGNQTCH